MDEIAKLAGVSKPTVSRVLNGNPNVAKATREKVLKVTTEYGYAINRQAQRLRAKQANAIAVMLDFPSYGGSGVSDPFIFDLLSSVSSALTQRGRDLLLASPPVQDSIDYYQTLTASSGADGVIFLGRGLREKLLEDLSKTAIPFVVWGTKMGESSYCCIGTDGFLGGKLAGEYLIGKGRRNILFVGDTRHKEIFARRAGLQEAVKKSGREISVRDLAASNFSEERTFEAAVELVRSGGKPPDALFAYSDTAAMAFVSAFRIAGLTPPRDFNVVGYNNIKLSEYFYPPLTTIHQNSHLAGHILVEKLDQMMAGQTPTSVTMETGLVDRGS